MLTFSGAGAYSCCACDLQVAFIGFSTPAFVDAKKAADLDKAYPGGLLHSM
jgi:hypothetical protein